MSVKCNILTTFIMIFMFLSKSHAQIAIENYKNIFIPMYNLKGELKIAIRSYFSNNDMNYLLVDPVTLVTETDKAVNLSHRNPLKDNQSGYFTTKDLENTNYFKTLKTYSSPPYLLQNYGLTHSDSINGMFLSVDLCPSKRFFERDFFRRLLAIADEHHKKFPIAIAISGLWIRNHQKEFNWLIKNEKSLDITWVNHSFGHPYFKGKPFNENFLLFPGIDMKSEVLMTEKLLLQHNQVPSIFFRFPGLVSNEMTVKELNKLGLIPVGSNAWLAKGEHPKSGSVVLIHGNGNEPLGIKMALKLINHNINWLPLNYVLSENDQ